MIIREVMQGASALLKKAGVRMEAGRCRLPDVQVDRELRGALEHVMEFCAALLPEGGVLTVEAKVKEVSSAPRLEVLLINRSPSALGLDEHNVFRPYLKIQQRRVGLRLLSARQMLRRRYGDIIFKTNQDDRGLFAFLIQLPAQRPCPGGG